MKKNYLLFTLLGALVISGCKNDDSSSTTSESSTQTSSISSSSSELVIPTMTEAVAHISDNYTIAYSIATKDSNGNVVEYEFKNALERLTLTGAENNLVYFSEYNEYGYYITSEDSYVIYNNGYGKPIYTTNGKLAEEDVVAFERLIDLNGHFSAADWELQDDYTSSEFHYLTRDKNVIATASFLTDDLSGEADSVMATVTKKGKNYRISGFTTYDVDGYEIVSAEVQRVGGSMAINSVPVLDDSLDETFKTRWLVATEYGNDISKANDMFEITNDNRLVVYNMNTETGEYTKNSVEYTFVAPMGDGSYAFQNSDTGTVVLVQYYGGNLLLRTAAAGAQSFKVDICIEYYTYWFTSAAQYLGYIVEEMFSDDDLYPDAVLDFEGAIRAYYIYSVEVDPTTGAESIGDIIVVTQYLNQETLINNYFEGDVTLYNGCVLGGMVYGNFLGTMASSQEAFDIMYEIASVIPPSYAEFDSSVYPEPTAGQTALDYMVAYMTSQGYEYMNKEKAAAQPDFTINTVTDDPEAGLNFNDVITKILTNYASVPTKDAEGNTVELFKAEDFYIFYKANPDDNEEKEGDEYIYAGFLVCDREIVGYINFYEDVFLMAMGYFIISGEMYGALETWKAAQPAETPTPTPSELLDR